MRTLLVLIGLALTACSAGTASAAVDGFSGPTRDSGDKPGSDGGAGSDGSM